MMKTRTKIAAASALALAFGGLSLQAQVYSDSADFLQYVGAQAPNLYAVDTNGLVAPMLATTGDGTPEWRYRNTGPGVPAWAGNSYQIRYTEGDTDGQQQITGLTPGQAYQVTIYGVVPSNTLTLGSRYGIEISVNGGVTYDLIDNRGNQNLYWVDNSTELGASIPTSSITGDTRFYSYIPTIATADGSGNLAIDIHIPSNLSDGTATDRFVLDGFALSVPEPTTLALAGFGAAALLIFRRRS